MQIAALNPQLKTGDVAPEHIAGNPLLSEREKIQEASRQFEAILLRQILEAGTRTVIQSGSSDNSTAASIYQDMVTTQLADSISKSGGIGLARSFEQQLNHPAARSAVPSPRSATS